MKAYFKNLFEYNYQCNQALIEKLVEAQENLDPRILRLLGHVLRAHEIWNSRIDGIKLSKGPWEPVPIGFMESMDSVNYEASKRICEESNLDEVISYTNSLGDDYSNRISDILTHLINHGTHHRGQIAMLMREVGMEAIPSDFIYFKR